MNHEVDAPCGVLRGVGSNGLVTFRNIPYARPPEGSLRFSAPVPIEPWRGLRDATVNGPVPPQGKSRLAAVTGGDVEWPQSEDCLTLTVTSRDTLRSGRPVMVWIHGGGFVGGAGSLPWYAGDELARRGDVIVVSPNFRQGALGHLFLPGVSPGNLALLDIVAALRWVGSNIGAFGGDPDNVTLFGQSSGAVAINALLAMRSAKGLFRRAIIQSAPLGRPLRELPEAARMGERFADLLGLGAADADAFRKVSVGSILAAQGEFTRSMKRLALGFNEQAFGPVIDGDTLLPAQDAWGHARVGGVSLLIGTNRDEQAAQFFLDPTVQKATDDQAADAIQTFAGESMGAVLSYYRERQPGLSPSQLLGEFYTDLTFRRPTIDLAERRAVAGQQTWVYQFDWPSPAGFGACHCLELPFVFGSLTGFADAPMLRGTDPMTFQGLSQRMQDAWLGFAHTGNPSHPNIPAWESYGAEGRTTMKFDVLVEPQTDPAVRGTHPLQQFSLGRCE